MKDLKDFNFKEKVTEMIYEFCGAQDTDAVCNIHIDGRTVQVAITLIDEEEPDFNDFSGVPLIHID